MKKWGFQKVRYEKGFFEKVKCLAKTVKKCVCFFFFFFFLTKCLANTYKSGSLRDKLPKNDNVYIREFISYLNQLLHILTKKN